MKLSKALSDIKILKPNSFTDDTLTEWLSELDSRIYKEQVLTHEGYEDITDNTPYTAPVTPAEGEESEDTDITLLADDPYSQVYIKWLAAQIDLYSNDMSRYNNDMILYNNAFSDFQDYYNRKHLPLQPNYISI